MAELKLDITVEVKQTVSDMVRQALIVDYGMMWDDYCYENNVPSEIKLHGIQFLEHFANEINEQLK